MSGLALYRKYRPASFQEVLGQEHIVSALEGALALGRISHAYLFAGSRGTGKTSVARILARAVGTRDTDLYEIDAASNRGIDDVRALREGIAAAPFESPYKVYIIDEAHMLTKEAFSALLKTLEEPPAHAIFILATTEVEKLPETIVSRCETYLFRKPPQRALREVVERAAKKEGFFIEPAAAELIALLADGSYRDGYGILQKAIAASSDKTITFAETERITGSPASALLNRVIESVENQDAAPGLSALAEAAGRNCEMKVFCKLLLARLRFVLLLRNAPEMEAGIKEEVSAADFAFLRKLATSRESRIHSFALLEFLNAYDLIGHAALPQLPLELAIVRLTAGESEEGIGRGAETKKRTAGRIVV